MQELSESPMTDQKPVEGVCNGRIVAYWPSDYDASAGIRADGCDGYIPAMIVANWGQKGAAVMVPCVNLCLFQNPAHLISKTSVMFSVTPAKGCWTWIPKA